jgi:predicted Fe-S protein YdhL (DUF1289 family)
LTIENIYMPCGEIPSPCVRNCCLDERDVCLGCFRTIGEITQWNSASAEENREILARCRERAAERSARPGLPPSSGA